MIKPEDLKTGNLINLPESVKKDLWDTNELHDTSEYFEICSIEKDEVNVYYDGSEYEFDCNEINPIELNEELMTTKMNFIYFSDGKHDHFWQHDDCDYIVRKTSDKFAFQINPDGENIHSEYIMHTNEVHTFQNNFKALTGNKLIMK